MNPGVGPNGALNPLSISAVPHTVAKNMLLQGPAVNARLPSLLTMIKHSFGVRPTVWQESNPDADTVQFARALRKRLRLDTEGEKSGTGAVSPDESHAIPSASTTKDSPKSTTSQGRRISDASDHSVKASVKGLNVSAASTPSHAPPPPRTPTKAPPRSPSSFTLPSPSSVTPSSDTPLGPPNDVTEITPASITTRTRSKSAQNINVHSSTSSASYCAFWHSRGGADFGIVGYLDGSLCFIELRTRQETVVQLKVGVTRFDVLTRRSRKQPKDVTKIQMLPPTNPTMTSPSTTTTDAVRL